MCGMCSDVVDGCDQVECGALPRIREDGTRRNHYMRWFTFDDVFCKHKEEKYGTTNPSLASHVEIEHDWDTEDIDYSEAVGNPLICDDLCIMNGWYKVIEVKNVVEALRRSNNGA
jgi:hypothetical protein